MTHGPFLYVEDDVFGLLRDFNSCAQRWRQSACSVFLVAKSFALCISVQALHSLSLLQK